MAVDGSERMNKRMPGRWSRSDQRRRKEEAKKNRKQNERTNRENGRMRVPLVMRFDGRSEFGYLIREREKNTG